MKSKVFVLRFAVVLSSLLAVARAQNPPSVPAGVTAHRDLAYVTGGHAQQTLDLFVPEKPAAPTPLVVWIHGGAWISGDKSDCPPLRDGYPLRGYAVASLNYRLSGVAQFPAQIEDCKAALRWLRAHAKDYNLDPDHIGVWGGSAGGHLVALLGTSGKVPVFDVGENLDQSSRVQAVADYFGPTDFVQMDAHRISNARLVHDEPNSPESRLVGGPIQDPANAAKVQSANPITYATADDPPFLIVHGDQDPLVPHHQSELLYAALVKAAIPVRFITVSGGGHGERFPGAELNPIVREFFDRHLRGNMDVARWPAAMTSTVKATAPAATTNAAPRNDRPADQTARGANQGAGRGGPPSWEQVVQRDDADHDGRLARSEFKGPAPLFDRLDANHDGFLTEQEHEDGLRAMGRR